MTHITVERKTHVDVRLPVVLSKPQTLSFRVALVIFPLSFLGPVFIDRAKLGGSIIVWAAANSISYSVMIAVMLTGALFVKRISLTPRRAAATLIVLLLAIALRGFLFGILTVSFGLSQDPLLWYRLGMGYLYLPLLVGAATLIVAWDQYTFLIDELESKRQLLMLLQSDMREQVNQASQEMIAYVRARVVPKLAELDGLLQGLISPGQRFEASKRLVHLIDDDLRPLTKEILSGKATTPVPLPASGTENHISRYVFPPSISVSQSLRVRWMTTLIVLSLVVSASRDLILKESIQFISFALVFVLVFLAIGKVIFGSRNYRTGLGFVIVVGLSASVGALTQYLAQVFGIPSPTYTMRGVFILGGAIGIGNVTYTLLSESRKDFIASLEETVSELELKVGILRQHTWLARRRLTYAMHGPLQGSLYAAAIKLNALDELSEESLNRIRSDIESAYRLCELTESTSLSFDQAMQEIVSVWEELVDIKIFIDALAQEVLAKSGVTASCAIEVIGECISNAVRHGAAHEVNIEISSSAAILTVRISDDGSGLINDEKGLGKTLFDEVCTDWKLIPDQILGTVFIANFAFTASDLPNLTTD